MPRIWFKNFAFYFLLSVNLFCSVVKAEPGRAPNTALDQISIFNKGFDAKAVIEIQDLTEKKVSPKKSKEQLVKIPNKKDANAELRYLSQNPDDDKILPPDQTPSVRVNPDAPSSIRAMISAKRQGDSKLALSYAGQFVRYQQSFFFEVREMVDLIGKALIKENVIEDDEWIGVGQMIDYELAKTRYEEGSVLKPTHESAMKLIQADPKQEIEVYYFFSLACSWCRYMAPDVERLWRLAKQDPRIKMTALTINGSPKDWLTEYKNYADWTVPVVDGEELARHWSIGFVPALVIVTPNGKKAFMKTGQQTYERMYEFMRTAQGLPATVTAEFKSVAVTPIGQVERMKAGNTVVTKVSNFNKEKELRKVQIQRF